MKKIVILGSTGSVGRQTLEVVSEQDTIEVVGLTANRSIDLLEEQILQYRPTAVAVMDESSALELKGRLARHKDICTEVLSGMEGLCSVATLSEAQIVVTAIVGMIGLEPTVAAIKAGKDIALANKETLVTAGSIIMPMIKEYGVRLLPVDSEHSAIFQSLGNADVGSIESVVITASGGPFRGFSHEQLAQVTKAQALKHPNWAMGAKITIDSSTLVNKGLEVIEAKWLFDLEPEQVQVVVHPQSIIHSMVEFRDGSMIAQLGYPDMKLPIQYALGYPDRLENNYRRLKLAEVGRLTFEEPDRKTFRGLQLAYDAMSVGGSMPVVYNMANEVAVERFLREEIPYLGIAELIEDAMNSHEVMTLKDIEDVQGVRNWTEDFTGNR